MTRVGPHDSPRSPIAYRTAAEVERELQRAGSALAYIRELDPEHDFHTIYRVHALVDFPWDVARALELALFRTYAIPSIGRLLHATREFALRPQRRYEDTGLLLTKVLTHGFEGEGLAAIKRINQLHRRFEISNADMLYVLSTFVAVPLRWLERFGFRPLLEAERVATHAYYSALGAHMGIRDIPRSWRQMLELSDAYEREHFAYNEPSARVGHATRELLVGWYPRALAPLTRACVHALLDEPLRRAFGFPAPHATLQHAVVGALHLRASVLALSPRRRRLAGPSETLTLKLRTASEPSSELGPDGVQLPGATEPRGRLR